MPIIARYQASGKPLHKSMMSQFTDAYEGWRHQMEIFSALLILWAGNSPVTGEFPSQRSVTRSFGVFFDQHLNKRLSKQSIHRWFETSSRSLWCHCKVSHQAPIWQNVSKLNLWQLLPTGMDCTHDDVIKWRHLPRYWPFVWRPVNSPHKGQWRGALMFSLICV